MPCAVLQNAEQSISAAIWRIVFCLPLSGHHRGGQEPPAGTFGILSGCLTVKKEYQESLKGT